MANFIDIKDFDGALTNADIEDLPDNVAQEIKNLKIQAGKLEKTFGAGTPSGIPTIGLSFVNTTLGTTYTVYNIYTFISDKFSGSTNNAGDGYRYLLVTIGGDNKVKLWWFDSSKPDVTDHLQIEDDVVWFKTASAHGIVEDDYVLVQDCKDNASPQASISGAGVYQQADHITSTKEVGVNTDLANWGGAFFDTSFPSGAIDMGIGGKYGSHLLVDDSASHGSPATIEGKMYDIAMASMNGKVLSLMSFDSSGTKMSTYNGSGSITDLSETKYNIYKAKSNFKMCSMLGFNNAIYVHFTYTDGGTDYNPVVKYTCSSSGSIDETVVTDSLSSTDYATNSFMHIANSRLHILVEGNGLYSINSTDNVTTITIHISPALNVSEFVGLTSIPSQNNLTSSGGTSLTLVSHEYLVVVTSDGTRSYFTYKDILDTSSTTWYTDSSSLINGVVDKVTFCNFGQNSNRSTSVVIHYTNSGNHYVKYSTHSNSSVFTGWADVSSSVFTTSTVITLLGHTTNSPGSKFLLVGTDNVVSPASNGVLYSVSSDSTLTTKTRNTVSVSAKGSWNPTCFADCVTETHGGQNFFEHAKGYIGVYGTEASNTDGTSSSDLYRFTDIGWLANTWNGTGDCDYRWIDILSHYDIKEIDTANSSSVPDIYHKQDRNPIVVNGDAIRFLPGGVGKISNTEAKGVWLGHIDRSLFNGTVATSNTWFVYSNKLNNPFSIGNNVQYNTTKSLRPGNSVKYNVTAVYDGIQESLFDKSKEVILSDSNVNKSIVELHIEFDASALNKRITGLNVYRATEFANTTNFDGYSNYQLIGHMTFVDTQNAIPTVQANSRCTLHTWKRNIVFLKTTDDLTAYDGESWLTGRNDYALGVKPSLGWDGIDTMTQWKGPADNNVNQFTVYHSPLLRKMNANQLYMIVSALATDNTLANGYNCEIDQESVKINDVASVSDKTGFTATVPSGVGELSFNMSSAVEGYFVVGDKIRTITSPGMATSTFWTVNSVGTGSSTTITATRDDNGTTTGASGVAIIMQEPASGVMVGIDRHDLGSPAQTINGVDGSTNSIPATHDANTNIFIRANSLGNSYSQAKLDANANMGNAYLDDGTMIGADWEIEKYTGGGNYGPTGKSSSSGGAFGGPKVAFLKFLNPDDITGTLGVDTTGDLLTVDSYAGSVLLCPNDQSYVIENNSAYEPTLGGCWVKLNEDVESDFMDVNGFPRFPVNVISSFRQTNAQGATTPGMAYQITSGTNVRVVCQDYRLEDLGETDVQTVFSNRINAQYAVKLKGRMFLGDLNLNPEDKQEKRPDWIAYSELNQYDVRPVSNVITLDDREGGAVTGLAVLFGRLIIFKPQAIFIMNVPDPANPNTWNVSESKFSIGNIAPEGVVEVHDSVYFVFHDGIYAVTSNMVANSNTTPTIMDKISLPIEDQFLLATSIKDIKGVYNQKDSEVLYTWDTGSPATQVVWAYHIVLKTWRKVETTTNLDILAYGENSYPIAWDNTDTDIKKFDVDEAVGTAWKSKRFRLDLDQKRLIRYGMVKFTGTDTLTVNVYLDGSGSVSFTKNITADGGVNRFPIKRYGKNFEIELTTPSSTNSFSVEQMRIETE